MSAFDICRELLGMFYVWHAWLVIPFC